MSFLKNPIFIFISFFLLIMFFFQIRYHKTKKAPLSVMSYFVFSEIQTAGVNFKKGLSDTIKKYFFLLDLREKNKKLMRKNQELQTKFTLFDEMIKENTRLKKILQFPLDTNYYLLPAQVVGTDILAKNELLTLNKGSQHGIKKFMGVLHPQGVVGYIFRTSPNSAQVISMHSPLMAMPARNQRNRISGLVESYPNGMLVFNPMDIPIVKDTDLQIGDQLISLKTDYLPMGFPVGTIVSLKYSSKHVSPTAYVKPAVSFYSLEEVLIVLRVLKKDTSS